MPRPTPALSPLPPANAEGCRIYRKATRDDGYVTLMRYGVVKYAHVWFWESLNGPVPEGMELDHICRNRACVEPAHLEPVSHIENIRRGWDRGRPDAKLSLEMARQIRQRAACGESRRAIARSLSVDPSLVSRVVNNHYWKEG